MIALLMGTNSFVKQFLQNWHCIPVDSRTFCNFFIVNEIKSLNQITENLKCMTFPKNITYQHFRAIVDQVVEALGWCSSPTTLGSFSKTLHHTVSTTATAWRVGVKPGCKT